MWECHWCCWWWSSLVNNAAEWRLSKDTQWRYSQTPSLTMATVSSMALRWTVLLTGLLSSWQSSDSVSEEIFWKLTQGLILNWSVHSVGCHVYHKLWTKDNVFPLHNTHHHFPNGIWICGLFQHWHQLQNGSCCSHLLSSIFPSAWSSNIPQSSLIGTVPQWRKV